jgi:hypothetical protein
MTVLPSPPDRTSTRRFLDTTSRTRAPLPEVSACVRNSDGTIAPLRCRTLLAGRGHLVRRPTAGRHRAARWSAALASTGAASQARAKAAPRWLHAIRMNPGTPGSPMGAFRHRAPARDRHHLIPVDRPHPQEVNADSPADYLHPNHPRHTLVSPRPERAPSVRPTNATRST